MIRDMAFLEHLRVDFKRHLEETQPQLILQVLRGRLSQLTDETPEAPTS